MIEELAARLAQADLAFGHGTDNARDEAFRLVTGALGGRSLTMPTRATIEELVRRRIEERVPVPHLTGQAWLCGIRFAVPCGAMIPRSALGTVLADGVVPWVQAAPGRVLDLCCGVGALGIVAAHAFPTARVDLVDNDAVALRAAAANVERQGLAERVSVVQSDLFESMPHRRYDLIVCNPPYVPSAELADLPTEFWHEPRHGLDGGEDGLAVWRRVLARVDEFLTPAGVLLGETGNASAAFDAAFPWLRAVWLDVPGAERQEGGDFGVFVAAKDLRAQPSP